MLYNSLPLISCNTVFLIIYCNLFHTEDALQQGITLQQELPACPFTSCSQLHLLEGL